MTPDGISQTLDCFVSLTHQVLSQTWFGLTKTHLNMQKVWLDEQAAYSFHTQAGDYLVECAYGPVGSAQVCCRVCALRSCQSVGNEKCFHSCLGYKLDVDDVVTLAEVLPWLSPGCGSAHERRQVFSELWKDQSWINQSFYVNTMYSHRQASSTFHFKFKDYSFVFSCCYDSTYSTYN